jgi:hypothetical protein
MEASMRSLLVPGISLIVLTAVSHQAVALDRRLDVRSHAVSDLSAAKKKKPQYKVVVRRAPPVYVARPWADPSFGPDGRPYRNPYPPNECSTDEGYGRFSPCTFRN